MYTEWRGGGGGAVCVWCREGGRRDGDVQEPLWLISSHRTATMGCPFSSSLAMTEARRPSKWPRQSMTLALVETMVAVHCSWRKSGEGMGGVTHVTESEDGRVLCLS